jgi:hypothetical protein
LRVREFNVGAFLRGRTNLVAEAREKRGSLWS